MKIAMRDLKAKTFYIIEVDRGEASRARKIVEKVSVTLHYGMSTGNLFYLNTPDDAKTVRLALQHANIKGVRLYQSDKWKTTEYG